MVPADDVARRIDARAQRVHVHRTVVAALHVVLARPHHLDRDARLAGLDQRHGDRHRFQHVVGRGTRAASEAAAGVEHVELDLLGLQSRVLGDRELVAGLELLAVPHFAQFRRQLDHAVQRFHRRVREIRELERCLEFLRGGADGVARVAVLARRRARRRGELHVFRHHRVRRSPETAWSRPTRPSAHRGPSSPPRRSSR